MIKPIMIDEIAENIVNFRDSVTVNISQSIPKQCVDNYRIVKRGTTGTLVNNPIRNHHDMIDAYKNLTMALFKRSANFKKYLNKNNKYNIEPITQNRISISERF